MALSRLPPSPSLHLTHLTNNYKTKQKILKKAVTELENYIHNFNKELDFDNIAADELHELFLDECYNFESLSHEIVLKFLQHGARIDLPDWKGLKPFQYASRSDNVAINAEFLSRGADVNEKYAPESRNTIWTNYHSVVYDKVKLYLDHGAEVNAIDGRGDSVLHDLAECGQADNRKCLELVIERGGDVNILNSLGKSSLFCFIFFFFTLTETLILTAEFLIFVPKIDHLLQTLSFFTPF
jgi:ankyrin repeat protein